MSIVIDSTPGGSTANSFVNEIEQIAYMANRLNASAWTTFSGTACTENEKKAMISATIELSMLGWEGRRSDTVQVLSWPRWSAINPDSPVGFLYLSTIIPDRVKSATCELAFQFLNLGTVDLSAIDPTQGVVMKRVDTLETQWTPYTRPQGIGRFPSVLRFIRPLLENTGAGAPILRG